MRKVAIDGVRERPATEQRKPSPYLPLSKTKKRAQYKFNNLAIAALTKEMRRIADPYAGPGKRKICVSRNDGKEWGALGREFVNMEDC